MLKFLYNTKTKYLNINRGHIKRIEDTNYWTGFTTNYKTLTHPIIPHMLKVLKSKEDIDKYQLEGKVRSYTSNTYKIF